ISNMKRVIITVIIIAAALAGIVFILSQNKAKNEADTATVAIQNAAVAVRADTADFKDVNAAYITNGAFAPKQEVMLSAEATGKVIRVLVEEGAYVNAGQTLAIIDGDRQSVKVSNAQGVYAHAGAEGARFASAFSTGGVTTQPLDPAKAQLENGRNSPKSAQLS